MLTYLVSLALADPVLGQAEIEARRSRSTELSDELSRRIELLEQGQPSLALAQARLEIFDAEGAITASSDPGVLAHSLAMRWDFSGALEAWPEGDSPERRRWQAAERILDGEPHDSTPATEFVSGCLDKISGTRPQLLYEQCLESDLAAALTADVISQQADWAKAEIARRLREILVEDGFKTLRGYRMEAGGPDSVYVWTLAEVHVSSRMFDQLAADELCATACGDLPLGQTWRSLDAEDRAALVERGGTLPLIQHFRVALAEEAGSFRVRDVFLLDSEPIVDSLAMLGRERRYRDALLGLSAPAADPGPAPAADRAPAPAADRAPAESRSTPRSGPSSRAPAPAGGHRASSGETVTTALTWASAIVVVGGMALILLPPLPPIRRP